jgi:RNA polymerase sigma-70 factor (ECF subfamily)
MGIGPLEGGVESVPGGIAVLVRKAKGYDRQAFAELYRFAVTPVYRYLAARVNRAEEAEELTQEVFVAALSGIEGLRAEDENGLLAWLFQIARHKLADHLRRRYRKPTSSLEEAEERQDPGPMPEEAAVLGEERAEVRRALERLTPEQREVVTCKYVLGYDNETTARVVGKNVNAVNQLHHRALASLHRLLGTVERTAS